MHISLENVRPNARRTFDTSLLLRSFFNQTALFDEIS